MTDPTGRPPEPLRRRAPDLDIELEHVRRAAQGDGASFAWLYEQYGRKVYNLVFRIVGGSPDAEEVTQEVFCQAYKGLTQFQGRSRFYTWLYRIAMNLALQHVQKRDRATDRISLEELTEKAGPLGSDQLHDPSAVVEDREFVARLVKSMENLSEHHRTVLTLGPILGHSYEEIGEVLNLTPEVVKGRMHRARERLREMMRPLRGAS